jgi:hypothetical protein
MVFGHAGRGHRLCAASSVRSRTIGGRTRKHAACQSDPVLSLLVSRNSACCGRRSHAHRSQTYARVSRRLLCGTGLFCAADLCAGARHDPRDRLCLRLCRARGPRHQARRPRRQTDPGGQYRFALRLYPPIWRPAAALDALSRTRAHDRGRPLERFRRPGAGRDCRHHAHGAWRLWHRLSPRRQGAGEGPEPASVLQMGGRRAPAGNAALELSQIPRRPRRPHRRGFRHRDRTHGRPRHRRDREGAAGAGRKHRRKR